MLMLVTGGAGFIGSHIVDEALRQGVGVRVLDSLRPDVHAADARPELPDGVELIVGDVRDASTVRSVLAGVDVVCHQAAKVGLGVSLADAADYTDSNVTGTAVLLTAMAEVGVSRLVLATAATTSSLLLGLPERLSASIATSNSAWAKPIGWVAAGEEKPRSPERMPRTWPRLVRTVVVLSSLRKSAIAGVIEPTLPNGLTGTQSGLPLMQLVVLLASSASRQRDCSV